MTRPELPIPPLIDALRRLGAEPPPGPSEAERDRTGDIEPVREAVAFLAERLGLRAVRVVIDEADPVPTLDVSWGTGQASSGVEPAQLGGRDGLPPLGRLWADGDPAAAGRAAQAVEAAVEAARAHLRADRAEQHLAALDAAVRGIVGVMSAEHVLQLIVDRVRDLASAQYAALGIVGDDGLIRQFLTSGISAAARRRIGALPAGHGLLGALIREGQTIRIPDIGADSRRFGFPAHHPAMRSFLGVPLTVRGRSVGNLYLTNKRGRAEFSAADQELVERFALHAGIAIENARLGEQVRELLVIEERERIGADLHDGVIQRIYGVNLSLDEVPDLVNTDPVEAARRVESAIESLNATITEIRDFIYILRPPGGPAGGLLASLHALAAEVQLQTGLHVEVEADADPRMAPEKVRELVSLAREALSNAARHAEASRAVVALTAGAETADPGLRLEVSDDGRGFDAAAPRDDSHHGLVNMRRRADRLGGTLRVLSQPGVGTRIILMLPDEGVAAGSEERAGHERARHEA